VVGAPLLLLAHGPAVAIAGIVVTGIGMGATFPLTSSLHVQASPISADAAMGQVLAVAAIGQIAGPLATGVLAQMADLRVGLLLVPVSVIRCRGTLVHPQPAGAAKTGFGRTDGHRTTRRPAPVDRAADQRRRRG